MNKWIIRYFGGIILAAVFIFVCRAVCTAEGSADLVLGQSVFTTNGITSGSNLRQPASIAVDPASGRVYVVDRANNRVLWWNNAVSLTNGKSADGVLGQSDHTSSSNGCSETRFNQPSGVCIDNSGNVWVADKYNNRVLKFASPTTNGEAAILVLGQSDFTSSPSGCTATNLNYPKGLFLDSSGNLWVTDSSNNRVLKFTSPATDGQAASLVLGQDDFTSNSSSCTANTFYRPSSISGDNSGNIWVVDNGNKRILKFASPTTDGQAASLVLGQSDFTSGAAGLSATKFVYPTGIALDSSGSIWVADYNRALKFASPTTDGEAASLVLGQSNFTSLSNGCSASKLYFCQYLTVDSSGNVWVSDTYNNRALKFVTPATDGQAASLVLGQSDFTSNGFMSEKNLNKPVSVAVDTASDRVYVCDRSHNRVLWWNNTVSLTNGKSADGVLGQSDFTSYSADCSATSFNQPAGVYVDSSGNVWVSDTYNNRVLKFASPTTNGEAASLVLGQSDFTSNSNGCTATKLSYPEGLFLDSSGNLWISDTSNNRVLKFTSPKTSGETASLVLGQSDFTSNSSGCTATSFNEPTGVSVDSSGNVWVLDRSNHRILKFATPVADGETASLVLGQNDFTTNTIGCLATKFFFPSGISFDGSGNLWVVDSTNHRVLMFKTPATDGQAASLVLGHSDFTSNSSGCTATDFYYPRGISVDSYGYIWVGDMNNNRVLRCNILTLINIRPNFCYISNTGNTITVNGKGFDANTEVVLTKTGETDITPSSLTTNAETIVCEIDLVDKETGFWNIVLSTGGPGSYSITLENALWIYPMVAYTSNIDVTTDKIIEFQQEFGIIRLEIPAGTFSENVVLRASTSTVPSADSAIIKASDICIEISNDKNLQPLKNIRMTLGYRPVDIGNFDESRLTIARHDEANNRWLLLTSSLGSGQTIICNEINHFSRFAIVQNAPAADLNSIKVYPNPYRQSAGTLKIEGVTADVTVKIYNIAGELICRFVERNGDGTAIWDGKNDSGNYVASGIYIARLISENGSRNVKIAIER